MASITRPSLPIVPPAATRPQPPHPGLEVDLEPLRPEIVAAKARGRFADYAHWAIWRYGFVVLAFGAFAGVAVTYLLSLTNNLSVEGDNAVYIILAKALATGHGYTNIQGPVPRIEAQFPFVFPLLLSPIVRFWGTDAVEYMQALVTGFALASFVLSFVLFRRWLQSAVLSLTVVLATAGSDMVWSFSHKVLTEIPYMFCTLLACWWASRYAGQERWCTWAGAFAAIAAAIAFLTRTIGVSLCVALPVYLLLAPPMNFRSYHWRLRLSKVGFSGVFLIALAGGWTLRNRLVYSGQGHTYVGQFFLKQTYVPDAGSIGAADLYTRVRDSIDYYAGAYLRMLSGHTWDRVPSWGDLSQGLLLVTLVGFVYAFIRRRSLAEFYLIGYVGIVLLWPWHDLRFVAPVMPFLLYYLANALLVPMALLTRLRPINPCVAAAMVLIPLAMPTGIHTLHTALTDRHVGYHYEVERLGEWQAYAGWRDFHDAALWLRSNGVPGSTVINRSPNLLYLWTGLSSRNYPYSFNQPYMLSDISHEHNDYVIIDDFDWTFTTDLYLTPLLKQHPERFFGPLFTVHGTKVYQVLSQ